MKIIGIFCAILIASYIFPVWTLYIFILITIPFVGIWAIVYALVYDAIFFTYTLHGILTSYTIITAIGYSIYIFLQRFISI